jgi:hypothetical protein
MGREALSRVGGVTQASRSRLELERWVPGRSSALCGEMPLAVAPADQAVSVAPPRPAIEPALSNVVVSINKALVSGRSI